MLVTRFVCGLLSFAALTALSILPARAQEAAPPPSNDPAASAADAAVPSAAQLETRIGDPSLAGLGAGLTRVMRAEIDALSVVRMSGTPALALDDLQLMVGCLGDTTECHEAMATQLQVDVLFLPALDLAGSNRVLTIVVFDRRDGSTRSAVRSAPDDELLVDSVAPALRELFGIEPPIEPLEPEHVERDRPLPAPSSGPGIIPGVVIGAVGVVALGAGLGTGLASRGAADDYREASVRTEDEVDAALSDRSRAARLSTTSTALLLAGGALTIGGVVLALLLARDPDDTRAARVRVSPLLGRGQVGLGIGGSL